MGASPRGCRSTGEVFGAGIGVRNSGQNLRRRSAKGPFGSIGGQSGEDISKEERSLSRQFAQAPALTKTARLLVRKPRRAPSSSKRPKVASHLNQRTTLNRFWRDSWVVATAPHRSKPAQITSVYRAETALPI